VNWLKRLFDWSPGFKIAMAILAALTIAFVLSNL
jgi:hypothetical protein